MEKNFSFSDYLNIFFGLESRQISNPEDTHCVPVIDFINHDEGKNVEVIFDDQFKLGEGIMVYALRDIKQGEQIVWHYGYKGNHELLQSYGFMIDDGSMPEEVEVVFEFEVNTDDDLY